jgi:ribonuclease HI
MWADLGPTSRATVYAAELLGILYSLMTVVTTKEATRATLFVDNQAAIQSVRNPAGQSGQMILRLITYFLSSLYRRGITVEICWIPAHTGVPGNEKADIIAKQATGWRSNGRTGPKAPQSKWVTQLLSAYKRTVKETIRCMWEEGWQSQETGKSYRAHFEVDEITQKVNQLYEGMTKPEAAVLVQLRTGKIGLGQYLKGIRVVDTAECQLCGEYYETISYVLGECLALGAERREYFGQPIIWDILALLSAPNLAQKAVKFMLCTGLLDQFRRATAHLE